jgi:7-carboxy-7-deazaguanine synthase
VTVETAGTIHRDLECDLMSVSPKLANSEPAPHRPPAVRADHAARRLDRDALARLIRRYPCQLKFVIAAPQDVVEIDALLADLPPVVPERVLLMPLGTRAPELAARARWIGELCKDRGWRYTPRLHIDLYGDTRGT